MFAIEELSRRFEKKTNGIVLAIAAAGFVSSNLSHGTGYGEARENIASGQAITTGYPF